MPHILIVEDDATLREVLRDALSGEHWCDAVATVENALVLFRQKAYDLVITDMSLPRGSGLQLLDEIRKAGGSTPVIVITGGGSGLSESAIRQLGATEYLLKPFNLPDIEAAVERAMTRRSDTSNT